MSRAIRVSFVGLVLGSVVAACPEIVIEPRCGFEVECDAGMSSRFQSFCDHLEESSSHLQEVLKNCPGSDDSTIYGFNQTACDDHYVMACTPDERTVLMRTSACDLTIAKCGSSADRNRATEDIARCAADAGTLSSKCVDGITH